MGGPFLRLLLLGIAVSTTARAETIRTQFMTFDVPDGWSCALVDQLWECQARTGTEKKSAIIIAAAKLRGPLDSVDAYETHVSAPKQWTSAEGKPITSTVLRTGTRMIAGLLWADALHKDAEVPGFFTRYVATVKQDIAIVFSYSYSPDTTPKTVEALDQLILSLKVTPRVIPKPRK